MKHLASLLLIFGFGISGSLGQTIKSLGYNTTNGQVVANTGTNPLTFTNASITMNAGGLVISNDLNGITIYSDPQGVNVLYIPSDDPPQLTSGYWNDPSVRASLGFSTNLNTLWTATNASNARSAVGLGWSALTNTNSELFNTAIGLGVSNTVYFQEVGVGPNNYTMSGTSLNASSNRGFAFKQSGLPFLTISNLTGTNGGALIFHGELGAATSRTNLGLGWSALTNTNVTNFREAIGLGATNTVTFSNLVINGNFTNNGTIYGLKTNVGPFEGIGNFFASNNTTVGNETLFRVGVAETTNKSAQFGFRVARTNNGGEGLAVFSVFGYNALMMIGPSDRSRSNSLTNTNAAIEADIWTMHETNRVMTLRDTNTGATVMHRPIGFNTNEVSTTAPSNTTVTNPTGWIQIYVGTNSVRVPYYQ